MSRYKLAYIPSDKTTILLSSLVKYSLLGSIPNGADAMVQLSHFPFLAESQSICLPLKK